MDDIKNLLEPEIPEELPILPLKDSVLFPHLIMPLVISSPKYIKLIDDVMQKDKILAIFSQKDSQDEDPTEEDIYTTGCSAVILKMVRFPDNIIRMLVQGTSRIRLSEVIDTKPFMTGKIEKIKEAPEDSSLEFKAMKRKLLDTFKEIVKFLPNLPNEVYATAKSLQSTEKLIDLIASNIEFQLENKQKILETENIKKRLTLLNQYLYNELKLLEVGSRIHSKVVKELDKDQYEYYLREQLRAIQDELGEGNEVENEIKKWRDKIKKAKLPEEAVEVAEKELEKMASMSPMHAEYTVSRNYLDWLVELPWSKSKKDNLNLLKARRILDKDHFDLKEVKDRIIEYIAVKKLKSDQQGPIFCFVGPPGVGKTSLGKSIARSLNREFYRMSVGGMHDEAEIKGHRRTYIGSMPGRIIQGIRKTKTNNPVFMLDEIDKIGKDFRGDPASALLEALDPSQNKEFSDHFLEVNFDLSNVMFITTANIIDTIPAPLLDRMEMLRLPGYIDVEKYEIASKYLIPRQIEANGLTKKQISFHKKAVFKIIDEYTREAGVRNLERAIGKVCRKVAKIVAEHDEAASFKKVIIKEDNVKTFLGPKKVYKDTAKGKGEVGVATGLAWTQVGGEIMFIEVNKMKGKGNLKLTGQLGDVMKESANIAYSYIKSNCENYKIDFKELEANDFHIHIPEGATPKDGPSAGITLTTAIISLLTGQPIRSDVAMTGEITLRGKVLPIGGLREKVIAAKRAKINDVIVPEKNKGDLEDLADYVKEGLNFHLVNNINEVINIALEK